VRKYVKDNSEEATIYHFEPHRQIGT